MGSMPWLQPSFTSVEKNHHHLVPFLVPFSIETLVAACVIQAFSRMADSQHRRKAVEQGKLWSWWGQYRTTQKPALEDTRNQESVIDDRGPRQLASSLTTSIFPVLDLAK